jgi:hypothetical protein
MLETIYSILDKARTTSSKAYKKRASPTITKRISSTASGLTTHKTSRRYYTKTVFIFIILI